MWSGCYPKDKRMGRAIVFAEHTVKGMRDPWFIDETTGAVYVKTWDEVLALADNVRPKKMVIYPMAGCQVLTNSSDFYRK